MSSLNKDYVVHCTPDCNFLLISRGNYEVISAALVQLSSWEFSAKRYDFGLIILQNSDQKMTVEKIQYFIVIIAVVESLSSRSVSLQLWW